MNNSTSETHAHTHTHTHTHTYLWSVYCHVDLLDNPDKQSPVDSLHKGVTHIASHPGILWTDYRLTVRESGLGAQRSLQIIRWHLQEFLSAEVGDVVVLDERDREVSLLDLCEGDGVCMFQLLDGAYGGVPPLPPSLPQA